MAYESHHRARKHEPDPSRAAEARAPTRTHRCHHQRSLPMVVQLLLEVWVGPPLRGFRREWEDGQSLRVARHDYRPCTGQGWRLATAWWCSLAVRSRICASVGGALCAVRCPRKQGSSGDEGLRRSIRVARGSAPPPPQRQQPQQQEQPLSLSRLSLSRLDRPQRASRAADACDGARMR